MLRYILAVIVSFSGLLVGSLIISLASEEQKPRKKYFIFSQNLILALIIALLLYFYDLNVILIIIASLIVFALSYYIKNPKRSYIMYPLIGIFFYMVLADDILLIILSLLTFVYGLVTAFLLVDTKHKKTILKIALHHATFLLTALLPFLISYL